MDEVDRNARLVRLTARRTIPAPVARVWRLWSTPRGLESWWAPEGMDLRVDRLEFRTGGRIEFSFRHRAAVEHPAWSAQLEREGHYSSQWRARGLFSEVHRHQVISWIQDIEFGEGGAEIPYAIRARFDRSPTGTRLTLAARSLRSKHWSLLGRSNLVAQLARLGAEAEKRPAKGSVPSTARNG